MKSHPSSGMSVMMSFVDSSNLTNTETLFFLSQFSGDSIVFWNDTKTLLSVPIKNSNRRVKTPHRSFSTKSELPSSIIPNLTSIDLNKIHPMFR